ncbi:MAG: flagellar basal body protein [Roseburia faecis]
MVKGLYTAHTGMVNEMKRLDILANNLANADTTAYKKRRNDESHFCR